MRSQPVGNADLWLSPQAIGSFYGNLYVLDPLLGRLFKYLPSNNEYVKTPLDYFDAALGVDLTGAVDMAIDSNVYILFADGTIKKYNNGQPVEFGMRGFYGTMRSPVAIYVSGGQAADAVGYVYVADAGNNRVLQFTKDGNFVRQFRAVESEPYMNNLRGLYVDEAERRMFLVSGEHFVLCTLPALQQ
jgi:DNA-binding beta-propeller fold protein YncE